MGLALDGGRQLGSRKALVWQAWALEIITGGRTGAGGEVGSRSTRDLSRGAQDRCDWVEDFLGTRAPFSHTNHPGSIHGLVER